MDVYNTAALKQSSGPKCRTEKLILLEQLRRGDGPGAVSSDC